MIASNWLLRAKERVSLRNLPELPRPQSWIGVDLAGEDSSRNARRLLPLLVLALVTALSIAALRIDLIRIRYAMASVVERETELREEQRNLIVRRRQLRDPTELAAQARLRGFRPAAQVIILREPFGSFPDLDRNVAEREIEELPVVAAGPRTRRLRGDWQ